MQIKSKLKDPQGWTVLMAYSVNYGDHFRFDYRDGLLICWKQKLAVDLPRNSIEEAIKYIHNLK